MCGIYITNLPLKEEKLKIKLDWISHRGPDFIGTTGRFIIWSHSFINFRFRLKKISS